MSNKYFIVPFLLVLFLLLWSTAPSESVRSYIKRNTPPQKGKNAWRLQEVSKLFLCKLNV